MEREIYSWVWSRKQICEGTLVPRKGVTASRCPYMAGTIDDAYFCLK